MASNSPLVYAVVVSYDGREFLDGCLRTLLSTDYDNLRILLVLNGSSDGSESFVREAFPEIELLVLPSNVGCLPACNQGMAEALKRNAAYVVLCNDDIEVLDDRWLSETIKVVNKDPNRAIIGYLESATRDVQLPESIEEHAVPHVVCFAVLLRAELLHQLGLFDLDFAMFAAEDDLILRAKRAGYTTSQLNLPFLHFGGGTVTRGKPETGYLQMRSAIHLCLKHRGLLRVTAKALRILDVACNPLPLSMNSNDNAHLRMRNRGNVVLNGWLLLRAIGWNLLHLPNTLRRRRSDLAKCKNAQRRGAKPSESTNAAQPLHTDDQRVTAQIQQPTMS